MKATEEHPFADAQHCDWAQNMLRNVLLPPKMIIARAPLLGADQLVTRTEGWDDDGH